MGQEKARRRDHTEQKGKAGGNGGGWEQRAALSDMGVVWHSIVRLLDSCSGLGSTPFCTSVFPSVSGAGPCCPNNFVMRIK